MDVIVRTSVCVHPFDYLGKPSLFGGGGTAVAVYLLLPAAADVALLPQKRPSVAWVVTCIL